MCNIDLEPCSVWSETIVTARKPHVCDCCGGAIKPGQKYARHFSVTEGDATSEKMCSPCLRVAEKFMDAHGTRSNPSYMPDLLHECVSESDTEKEAQPWRLALLGMQKRAKRGAAAQ